MYMHIYIYDHVCIYFVYIYIHNISYQVPILLSDWCNVGITTLHGVNQTVFIIPSPLKKKLPNGPIDVWNFPTKR